MNVENLKIPEKLWFLLEKYPEHVDPKTVQYRINADFLFYYLNNSFECEREILVSYVQMLPLLMETVPFEEADYILYEHETVQDVDMMPIILRDLHNINTKRKPGAEIIVLGKACNAKKLLEPGEIENITFYESHFAEKVAKRFGYSFKEQYFVWDTVNLHIWPVNGCMRQCAFCRRTFMHIPFESLPLKVIKENLDYYQAKFPEHMSSIYLRAENLTEYGLDLESGERLQDLIDLLNSYDEIKSIRILIGMAICEITPEILNAICRCKKIKSIALNVEVGNDRMLELVKKPHTRARVIEVYQTIRSANPDIIFESMAIVGLPTETFQDIEDLASLFGIIQPDWIGLMYYGMAPGHPLAKLPQLSEGLRKYHQHYFLQLMKAQRKDGTRTKPIEIRYAKTRKPGRKTARFEAYQKWFRETKGPLVQNYVVEFI